MRAAIYLRMSTDKQSADSPTDQIARCREYASARGWKWPTSLWYRTRESPAPRATNARSFSS